MNWGSVVERAFWASVSAFSGDLLVVGLLTGEAEPRQAFLVGLAAATLSGLKTVAQERLAVLDTRRG